MTNKDGFWGHIEVLRWMLLRCVAALTVFAVFAFCFKELLFEHLVLAPMRADFITYRLLRATGLPVAVQGAELINISLTAQLMTHIRISFFAALAVVFPYLIAELWFFVRPALYAKERHTAALAVTAIFAQFYLGLALAYFIIFPLTFNFLSTYQVSESVTNSITLSSYIDTFTGLLLSMGLVFELPVAAWFFARIGVLKASLLRRGRRLAVVLTLVAAALITPSTDIFTMCLVAMPLYLLYELSIVVAGKAETKE